MTTLDEQTNYYIVIVLCYLYVAALWFMVYILEVRWDVSDNASNLLLSIVHIAFSGRALYSHFILHKVTEPGLLLWSFFTSLALAIAVHYKNRKYCTHCYKYIKRLLHR